MKIGIIETGEPPQALQAQFGTYVTMISRFLGDRHTYEVFRAMDGCLPYGNECKAFVITGSASSAYERRTWMCDLEAWLQSIRNRTRLVGICFGHQIMAQAFGGKVERSSQGWGLGLHRYAVTRRAGWMDDVDVIHATASHRDQVVMLPPNASVLGASDFTPNAILSYSDHPAISVQFHPEFEPDFSRALFARRRAPDLPQEEVQRAIETLAGRSDNIRLSRWINDFIHLGQAED